MKSFYYLLFFILVFKTNNYYLGNNQYYERKIRGTKIIHVMLDMDSNSYSVQDYIKNYINSNYNGYVSSTLSYNSDTYGNINNYLKEKNDFLLAIYYDGGKREKRDDFYDYINLRWQGGGASNMYVFWKSYNHIKTLQHNNIIKISHFLNTNALFSLFKKQILKKLFDIINKSEKKNGKIMEKINESEKKNGKIMEKINEIKNAKFEKDLITSLTSLLEEDDNIRESLSELINKIEDISMEIISDIENIPVVGNIAQAGVQGVKTYVNAVGYPVNMAMDILDNILDSSKYKEINNLNDFFEDSFNFIEGIGDGIQSSTVNTIKNIGYGIKDMIKPITGENEVLDIVEDTFKDISNGANEVFDFFGNIFPNIKRTACGN